ncbi:carbon-nitrogen hydrolase family protein [Alteromonas halophila]|uniref:Amidohydrolase n=1 Tax=Alteromonas halophila TaxID=516698 RepID=A0A918MXH4_9ALTE|nr:carbon-nitrogen hydrolase family protein [Alteromonas halophila]GGW84016.1 amidohydrolase [Alteromonas halophila]
MVNLVAVQMTSTPDVEENLSMVEAELARLKSDTPPLVVLPECFACFGTRDRELLDVAESSGDGLIQRRLAEMAKRYQCYLISGTYPVKANTDDKFTATCQLYGPDGECLADYKKIHLFDVAIDDNTGSYKESKYTQAGTEVVTVQTPIGNIGLAVCYDVRFSGLFNAMGDIDILVLPSAFTQHTGQAHWHSLVKARAIEKQCFVVAANQTGEHANGRRTYGHSLIISPWGDTLAELPTETGSIQASCDLNDRQALKAKMPVMQHNRFRSDFV